MYLNDLSVGMEIDLSEVTVDRDRMMDFARLYDPLPLHLDDDYAKNTRFGGVIAPGVMTFMSVWAKFVETGLFGEQLVAGLSTKIEWFGPVYPGDTLKGRIRISNIVRRNAHNGIAETTMMIQNQHGEDVIRNVTESIIQYKE